MLTGLVTTRIEILKHVIEGNIEGTRRRGGRRKHLLKRLWTYHKTDCRMTAVRSVLQLAELPCKRVVKKVSSHFEYLDNRPLGLDVNWQSVRGDLTVHP
jgi:hypothetical protein